MLYAKCYIAPLLLQIKRSNLDRWISLLKSFPKMYNIVYFDKKSAEKRRFCHFLKNESSGKYVQFGANGNTRGAPEETRDPFPLSQSI